MERDGESTFPHIIFRPNRPDALHQLPVEDWLALEYTLPQHPLTSWARDDDVIGGVPVDSAVIMSQFDKVRTADGVAPFTQVCIYWLTCGRV